MGRTGVGVAVYLLHKVDATMSSYVERLCYFVDRIVDLITTEMKSIGRDIRYWTRLSTSPDYVISAEKLHSKLYRMLFGISDSNVSDTRGLDHIQRHLIDLEANLSDLSFMLANAYAASVYMKSIVTDVRYALQNTAERQESYKGLKTQLMVGLGKIIICLSVASSGNCSFGSPQRAGKRTMGTITSPLQKDCNSITSAPFPSLTQANVPPDKQPSKSSTFLTESKLDELGSPLSPPSEWKESFKSDQSLSVDSSSMSRSSTLSSNLNSLLQKLNSSPRAAVSPSRKSFHKPASSGKSIFTRAFLEGFSISTAEYGVTYLDHEDELCSLEERLDDEDGTKREMDYIGERILYIEHILHALDQKGFMSSLYSSDYYPIGMAEINARRPSVYERFWLMNCCKYAVGAVVVLKLGQMYRSGQLQQLLKRVLDTVVYNVSEHVVEPITKLLEQIVQQISRREGIVSEEDFKKSKEAYTRMLQDFSRTTKGFELYSKYSKAFDQTKIFQTVANKIQTIVPISPSGGSDRSSSGNGGGSPAATPSPVAPEHFSDERAWEALMSAYENEMKNPLLGLMFGSLMTSILIQVQKLKMNTEAAMLTMDQILTSNHLTMAGTAALPAIGIIFTGSLLAYQVVRGTYRMPKPGEATLPLRLALSDVDRSLEDLLTTANAANDYHSSYSQSHHQLVESKLYKHAVARGIFFYNVNRFQKMVRKIFSFAENSLHGYPIGTFSARQYKSEYSAVMKDCECLLHSDSASRGPLLPEAQRNCQAVPFTVSQIGGVKFEVINRMRTSYQCLKN